MRGNTLRLLRFLVQYPGWHTIGRDSWPAMRRLEAVGLVTVKRHDRGVLPQMRLALGGDAWSAIERAHTAD